MNPFTPRPRLAAMLTTLSMLLWLSSLFAAAPAWAATGSGTPATENRDPGAFQAITMRGDIDVVVRQGGREAVQVTTDHNLLPLLETRVETRGDVPTLHIEWKRGESVRTRARTLVTVDVVRLEALASAGSGDVVVQALKTPSLELSIAGSSDARLEQLDAQALRIGVSGSGDVSAAGRAASLTISIAGSGDVDARQLTADEASVSIAGSGDADVTVARSLAVSIAGSGDVSWGGGAALASARVAGSGSVRQRR
jgi:Putative auto-transporter adhesin, head GIN domain